MNESIGRPEARVTRRVLHTLGAIPDPRLRGGLSQPRKVHGPTLKTSDSKVGQYPRRDQDRDEREYVWWAVEEWRVDDS